MLTEDMDGAGQLARHGRVRQEESPAEALTRVTAAFAAGGDGWVQAGSRGGPEGEAQVCVVGRRYLHVVGMSPMASRLRELVAIGAAPGWALHPVPRGRTPVGRLAEPLLAVSGSARFYNLLVREGFATVEEVAATPDDYLLLLRQVGPAMVAAVRQVLGGLGLGSPEDARPAPAGFIAERLTRISSLLTGPNQERYRDFVGRMARSSLPSGALTTIAESLSGEPVPAADPLVCLLLDTAGEAELAVYYRRTHSPVPEDPAAD